MSGSFRVVIVQTHVPSFRLRLFTELHRRCGGHLEVWSGTDYFTPTTDAPARRFAWNRNLRNRFFRKHLVLWQSGHFRAATSASICILEFNPRVLSSWCLLLGRWLLGRPTMLWGHLLPRAGGNSPTVLLRLFMLKLAAGINTYTYSEYDRMMRVGTKARTTVLGRLFSHPIVNVSPNALMWEHEFFRPSTAPANRCRILFVARLLDEKKPLLLLEGFARALPALPAGIRLDFIGTGPCEKALSAKIVALRLQEKVALHGSIYDIETLRRFYDEAVVAVSPGYVGLSATQAFAFGVPMLIADREQHSVEIELCRRGFNCEFFKSNDPSDLAEKIAELFVRPPVWSLQREQISSDVSSRYTLDLMCEGFMRMIQPHLNEHPAADAPVHVAIAWIGLPYYAARVIAEAMRRHPSWRFTIISSRDDVPYKNTEHFLGNAVHWIDPDKRTSWWRLGEPEPDIFLITSWPHTAYRGLAIDAKRRRDTVVVSMVDNYLRYTLKQLGGFFYFRMVLRPLYSAMWVPGSYSKKFMRFLGVDEANIYTGLYAADGDIFVPPPSDEPRRGIIFVGQYVKRKGLRNLAEAVLREREAGREPELCLIGQGPMREELLAQGLRVEKFLQPEDLARAYQRATALILPSYIDHWGVVVHEAARCGCLLLVTRQCGCSHELVEHGVNGYVMERSSVQEVLAALSWLAGLEPAAAEIGRKESVRRAELISPRHWADTLDKLVQRFVPRASAAPVVDFGRQ
jgi:glycosyltransferase involved in cell wall biosynthesis